MYASTGPFNETVSLLLKAGAETNLFDNEEHFTALMFAAAEGQAEVVQSLLKYGADKSLLDIDGESAYDFAMANGHTEVALLLN
jgi:ankyrin repeat protein